MSTATLDHPVSENEKSEANESAARMPQPPSFHESVPPISDNAVLVSLTESIHRLHRRVINRIYKLALARGAGAQLATDASGITPLRWPELDRWRTSIVSAYYDGYGSDQALALLANWPKIGDGASIDQQRLWVFERLGELDMLLKKDLEDVPYRYR